MLRLITVLFIEILGAAEVDLFVPSFPDLQAVFSLSPFMAESLLAVNLVFFCIASIIVGTLGDRYGRKPVILTGLCIFITGSISCVCATSFYHLIIGRILQGIGISAGVVLSYLVISDLYSMEKQREIIGLITGTITLGMTVAPIVGSYINLFFGWRANFLLLLILACICTILSMFFLPKGVVNPNITMNLKEYLPVIKSKRIFHYNATLCFVSQAYWIFVAISPILYMNDLGVSLQDFGFYQGSLSVFFAIGSFSSGYFLRKYGVSQCIRFSIRLSIISLCLCLLLIILNAKSPLIITALMCLVSIANIIPCNVLWPLSINVIPAAKGRTTAFMTSSRLLVTAFAVQFVGYFYDGTFIPLGIAVLFSLLTGLISFSILMKREKEICYSE